MTCETETLQRNSWLMRGTLVFSARHPVRREEDVQESLFGRSSWQADRHSERRPSEVDLHGIERRMVRIWKAARTDGRTLIFSFATNREEVLWYRNEQINYFFSKVLFFNFNGSILRRIVLDIVGRIVELIFGWCIQKKWRRSIVSYEHIFAASLLFVGLIVELRFVLLVYES